MKKKKLLYFFYNRLNDPLLQSNIFLYINALSLEGHYDIAIVTYEDERFPLSPEQKKEIHQDFNSRGIQWYPLQWHAGSHLFLKSVDLLGAFKTLSYLVIIKGYRHVISLGSIAGSFLYLFSKMVRLKFYLYQYEPHSEYAFDNNIWPGTSMQYRLLNRFEKKSVKACTVVSSGTDNMRKRLKDWQIKAPFFKVSSVANDAFFNFRADQRARIRKELNIEDRHKLVIYPGKLGELYCSATQLLHTFKALMQQDADFRFLVITPNGEAVQKALQETTAELNTVITILPPVEYSQMPNYLSAADLGMVAVLPGPSKKFISNIKVGEYLCSGLPYLICRGISEDDVIAETYNVGIVVGDLIETEITRAYKKINALLSEPKAGIAERCRTTGILCRGFEKQYGQFKQAVVTLTEA